MALPFSRSVIVFGATSLFVKLDSFFDERHRILQRARASSHDTLFPEANDLSKDECKPLVNLPSKYIVPELIKLGTFERIKPSAVSIDIESIVPWKRIITSIIC